MFRLLRSLIRSIGDAVYNDPEIRKAAARHPKLVAFVRRRLSIDEKFGLYLTIGFIVTSVFLFLFLATLEDLLFQDPLIRADLRIVNSVQLFRSTSFNNAMLLITYLGNWQVILAAALAIGLFLALLRRWYDMFALVFLLSGGAILVWLLKQSIHRPRPDLVNALAHAQGFSFPSGHSFYAVALYGFIAYLLFREAKGVTLKSLSVIGAVFFIASIGFSRIYLGVHWPSDILAGYASGAVWLSVVITAMEIRRKYHVRGYTTRPVNKMLMTTAGLFLLSLWSFYVGYFYHSNPFTPVAGDEREFIVARRDIPQNLFTYLPKTSEDIIATPMEPINVIFVATQEELTQSFAAAGWPLSDSITLANFRKLMAAYIFDKPYAQAPAIPSYWNGRPNDLSYVKPTPIDTGWARYHVHIWKSPFILKDHRNIWFGNAHFDKAIRARPSTAFLPTHEIDPLLDKAKNKLKEDLTHAPKLESFQTYQLMEPVLGKNLAGDPFYTDGLAYVFFLQQ